MSTTDSDRTRGDRPSRNWLRRAFRQWRQLSMLVVVLAMVGTLLDCGSASSASNSSSTTSTTSIPPGTRVIAITARSFSFDPDVITVSAGEPVAIRFFAVDAFHTFTIQGKGTIVSANASQTRTGIFRLDQPGTYTFYCSVPGHRAAGMVGTIIVR
jgi:plastocyanin